MSASRRSPGVSVDSIRELRDRILASHVFSRSKRQREFLGYVIDASLEGREDRLKEYTIGLDVFGKDDSFDPHLDSIVRVEASRLRAKLREYYGEEGTEDSVRIEIPKGHYIPEFHQVAVSGTEPAATNEQRLGSRRILPVIAALLGLLVVYAVLDLFVLPERSNSGARVAPSPVAVVDLEKSIAVLPFRNLSTEPDDIYFVDGMHDDILTQLSNLSSLDKVISRTTMEQYRDTTKSILQISSELGVAIVLEGSVQRAAERVRVNVQLIDANSDRQIWSDSFDRELTTSNIFAIQREIANSIADQLQTTLSPEERQALDSIPTMSLRAYELYHQAQRLRRTFGLGSRTEVADLLEEAVTIDPEFALAHVALGRAFSDRYFTSERDKAHRTRARNAIDRAFEISPGMPAIHIALADYYYKGFLDYERAIEQLNFAIPMARGNAEAYALRAFILRRRGDIEQAVPDLDRAIELDPGNFSPYYVLAETYVMLRRYEESITYFDKAIELAPRNFGLLILRAYARTNLDIETMAFRELIDEPAYSDGSSLVETQYRWEVALIEGDYQLALSVIDEYPGDMLIRQNAYYPLDFMRGITEFYLGDRQRSADYLEAASVILEQSVAETPEDPRALSALGLAYAGSGLQDQALQAAHAAYELYPVDMDAVDGPLYVLNYAKTFAMLDEHAAAVDKLDELLSRPTPWYATLNVVLLDPAFRSLQDDAAFISLVEKHSAGD